MDDIKTLVEEAWDYREDHQTPQHKAVLAALARQGDSLSQDERGHAEFYLKWAVLDGAAKTDSYRIEVCESEYGGPVSCRLVDEEKFSTEIRWIRLLAEQRELSPKLDSWLARQRHAFVHSLRSDSALMARINSWGSLREADRRELLLALVRRRCESFNDGQLSLTPPEVEIYEDDGLTLGAASFARNEIKLNAKILQADDPAQALMVTYHEGTHNVLTQLALALGRQDIPKRHPLYEDACTLAFSRNSGLAAPALIRSIHGSDAEERLAFREQEYFLYNLQHGHGLRAKFELVRFVVGEYMDSNAQKPSIRALLQDLRFG